MNNSLRWPIAAALALTLGSANAAGVLSACAPEKLDGSGAIDLTKQPGRFVYVDFWASWCGPCKQSFPFMNSLKKQFEAKGVTVVAITVDKQLADATDFLKDHPADFVTVHDNAGKCAKELGVKGMPSSYIIDKNGAILFAHKGFRPADMETITRQLQQLTEK
jgi:cytochrome c biogenesis protein CcmG, thiol:disulfide interchange protein DsbE